MYLWGPRNPEKDSIPWYLDVYFSDFDLPDLVYIQLITLFFRFRVFMNKHQKNFWELYTEHRMGWGVFFMSVNQSPRVFYFKPLAVDTLKSPPNLYVTAYHKVHTSYILDLWEKFQSYGWHLYTQHLQETFGLSITANQSSQFAVPCLSHSSLCLPPGFEALSVSVMSTQFPLHSSGGRLFAVQSRGPC